MISDQRLSSHSSSETIDDADSITTSHINDNPEISINSAMTGVTANDLIRSASSNSVPIRRHGDKLDAAIAKVARDLDIHINMAERLRNLRNFEIVIICDDSGSMITPVDDTQRTRWDELCHIVKLIIPIGVMFDSNGVDVYFLNRPPYLNVKDPTVIDDAFREPPNGFTPLVSTLSTLFQSRLAARGRDKKLLILIATDGVPTDDNGNENIRELEDTMRHTRRIETTYVSFLLCTDDENCVAYMREWDANMKNIDVIDDYQTEKTRIQQCQGNDNFHFSYGDYVVKALIGAIDSEIGDLNNFRNE